MKKLKRSQEHDHALGRNHCTVKPSSPISELPNELMISILKLFRNGSTETSDYIKGTSCCKKWAGLGLPLTYADLVIDSSWKLIDFTTDFPQQHLQNITSLTVTIKRHTMREALNSKKATDLIVNSFLSMLSGMVRLKTFSLRIEDGAKPLDDAHNVDGPFLMFAKDALEVLPLTVINLELSTSKMQDQTSWWTTQDLDTHGWPHLCETLCGVLPRLHRLSLHLRDICPQLFGIADLFQTPKAEFPFLRQAFIDISLPRYGLVAPKLGISEGELSHMCNRNLYQPRDLPPLAMEITSQVLLRDLRRAMEHGAFPRIQSFIIHRAEIPPDRRDRGTIQILDVVSDTTASLPVAAWGERWAQGTYHGVKMKGSRRETRCIAYIHDLPYLPDLGAWYTTIRGSRLPGIHDEHEYHEKHRQFLHTFRTRELLPKTCEDDYSILFKLDYRERSGYLSARAYRWNGLLETDRAYGLLPPGYRPKLPAGADAAAVNLLSFTGSFLYPRKLLVLERVY